MSKWNKLAAVGLMTAAMIASTTASAWAFTQETLNPNGNYNFNFGPLDGKGKSGDSTDKSDPNSPGFHFSVDGGQQTTSPFGFHSFGSTGPATPEPPGYRPIGSGN